MVDSRPWNTSGEDVLATTLLSLPSVHLVMSNSLIFRDWRKPHFQGLEKTTFPAKTSLHRYEQILEY